MKLYIRKLVESLFDDDIFNNESNEEETLLNDLELSSAIPYVDLGLPSGTLWCKCNVGAKNETDFGDYYQWGNLNKKEGDALEVVYDKFTKYTEDDGLTELLQEDDIVAQTTKDLYKIPTKKLINELVKKTKHYWVNNFKNTNVNGMIFESNINNSYIFIPAPLSNNLFGFIWSSTLYKNPSRAFCLAFSDDGRPSLPHNHRSCGFSVRGVASFKK